MRWLGTSLSAVAVSLVFAGTAVNAGDLRGAGETARGGPQTACLDVGGMDERDRHAMREFMRSDQAPQAMARMMEMARRMGDGDVMDGMDRMIDMMGRDGRAGMMGGRGGMMRGRAGMMGGQGGMMPRPSK